MYYRELGRTGIVVSEVGMGCNRLGQGDQDVKHWVGLVRRAADLGVTVFDTSESYGWGRSEEILGQALGNRDGVYVATKVSRVQETNEKDFSSARIVAAAERSLRRLRRDCLDVYQLHSPSLEDLKRFDWAEGLAKLKEQGKIRGAGVAVNHAAEGVWLARQGLVEVLQITHSIFVVEAETELFDLAAQQGIGLLCRMPLARGVLTGKFRPGQEVAAGHRALMDGPRMAENIQRAESLRRIAESYPGGMTRMALHFGLMPQAISAIIPGARTLEQLEENVSASDGVGLLCDVRNKIDQVRVEWQV
jgi:aryl-alcohol dehydrogenase-like predicted oxidoreductase